MAVRLLPKSEIDKRKAEQQRQEIQEGLKVANRVDSLREILASETSAFENFRLETLRRIQEEISKAQKEKEAVESSLTAKKKELLVYMGPLDLQWADYVKGEKSKIDSETARLARVEAENNRFRSENEESKKRNGEESKKLGLERLEYQKLIQSAEEQDKRASEVLRKAQKEASRIRKDAEEVTKKSLLLSKELSDKEEHLRLEESRIAQEREDIRRREFKVLAKELQYYSPVHK